MEDVDCDDYSFSMEISEAIELHLSPMGRREVLALLRTIDLFEMAGIWSDGDADAWRTAARFRAAELNVPPAQA